MRISDRSSDGCPSDLFSGIEAETFSDLMDQFEPLDPNDATPEQRRQRRHDIVRLLSHVDLPILQALIPATDSIWLRLREYWREGHWCRLNMLPRQQAEGPRYLFTAGPAHGEQTIQSFQQIGRAHVWTPVTPAHYGCRL